MRIATYNVEWFTNLFANDGSLLDDDRWSGRRDVTRAAQLAALGVVFGALDSDAVMIIEAPDSHRKRSGVEALQNFAERFSLRARRAIIGFRNDTQQEIALLFDPDRMTVRHDPQGPQTGKKGRPDAPRFDGVFRWDLDVDAKSDLVRFSKPPLEVDVETADGTRLRLIGVHVKSKAPHGARNAKEITRISIDNRRKQLAQSIWLRGRIVSHLDAGDSLIVLGDLNDGPGLDEYEKLFGRSSVEIVIGEDGEPCLCDPHAQMLMSRRVGAAPVSSRFYIAEQKRYLQVLLDYVMVSADLRALAPTWRIWHPHDDPVCYQDARLREALLTASDHFPVSIDLDI